jgi:hypothetical protein
LAAQQKTTIPAVPVRSKLLDRDGNLARQWIDYFQRSHGGAGSGAQQLVLSVPGTLGIRSSAAPLVALFAGGTASEVVAVVKTAPAGADLTVVVNVDAVAIATVTVKDGETAASSGAMAGAIAAGDGTGTAPGLVTVDITGVGSTFPGADLSVLIQVA